jgi:hypothetical protein
MSMNWFPIGPDFVFLPRNANFKRLSRHNEKARQCRVEQIVVDPTAPDTIYVVGLSWWGGKAAFRSKDGGESWVRISESLQRADPAIDPMCIAVNTADPSIVYLGTDYDGGFYVSKSSGDPGTWSARTGVGGPVTKLIVDPSSASNPGTTILYAATSTGVWRSGDGGSTWDMVLSGEVTSLAVHFPENGEPAYFYAGVANQGVFLATTAPNSGSDWHNLNKDGDLLPAGGSGTVLVDLCPRNPACAYVYYITTDSKFKALYTTTTPLVKWTSVAPTPPPVLPEMPGGVVYARVFAVSPNSPGDGAGKDILFFGGLSLYRSTDSGRTWKDANYGYENIHGDVHTFAFSFIGTAEAPWMYLGDDGGIQMSTRAADPAFEIDQVPSDFNEGADHDLESGSWQNLNHGRQSSIIMQYASDPAISAIGYIGCQDTGLAGGCGALGWRGLGNNDASSVAAIRSDIGVKVWYTQNTTGALGINTQYLVDKGNFDFENYPVHPEDDVNARIATISNHIIDHDGACLAGCVVLEPDNIHHRGFVTRIKDDVATQISQEFFKSGKDRVFVIAKDPVNPDILYCATSPHSEEKYVEITWAPSDSVALGVHRLWKTESGKTADANTVWSEISNGRPTTAISDGNTIDMTHLTRPAEVGSVAAKQRRPSVKR